MAKPSFAGRGLLERARSTTFALLGVTAALCLGLVALVSQQSVFSLPPLPLPGLSAEPGKVGDARVVAEPSAPPAPRPAAGEAEDGASVAETGKRPPRRAASEVAGSRQLAVAPTTPPTDPDADDAPGQEAPTAAPAPPPASEPSPTPAASQTSPPTTPPSVTSPPGKSTAVVEVPGENGNQEGDDSGTEGDDGQESDDEKAKHVQPGNGASKYRPPRTGRGKPERYEPAPVTTPAPSDEGVKQEESSNAETTPVNRGSDDYRGYGHGRGYGRSGR